MKVATLIKNLQKLDPNALVLVYNHEGENPCIIDCIETGNPPDESFLSHENQVHVFLT